MVEWQQLTVCIVLFLVWGSIWRTRSVDWKNLPTIHFRPLLVVVRRPSFITKHGRDGAGPAPSIPYIRYISD